MINLEGQLAEWLPRQRWYAGTTAPTRVEVRVAEEVLGPDPKLTSLVVSADGVDWHVLAGCRPLDGVPSSVTDHQGAVIGEAVVDGHAWVVFDAMHDAELASHLLYLVTGEQSARHSRPVGGEQSNTSMVFDDEVVVKLFRRIVPGENPDVAVPSALSGAGFANVPEVCGVWRVDEFDLAVAQRYLPGATDGFALALTSLRDCLREETPPERSGGNFAGESARLGQVTAELHLALAKLFPNARAVPGQWSLDLSGELDRAGVPRDMAVPLLDRLAGVTDAGMMIRGHGDYHLAQVLRADPGWFVIDFEGEPDRSAEERSRLTSPLRDVAGMTRSFDYVAGIALSEQVETDREHLEPLARAWVGHNCDAFHSGYTSVAGIERLLPAPPDRPVVLAAFELEKAVYELAYERAHRPDWVSIPEAAIERLLSG